MRILGISSGGGHLTELLMIVQHLPPLTAIVTETNAAERNQTSEFPLRPIRDPHRSPIAFALNGIEAMKCLYRHRPDVVISTGAGITVPLFIMAWLLRKNCIYVETGARITTPSFTGRLLYPIASLFIIQSSSLQKYYKKAIIASILQ